MNDMKLFHGRAHPQLAKKISEYLGLSEKLASPMQPEA